MSFTTGGLFLQESLKVATLYLDLQNWKSVSQKVLDDNILQTRTLSTAKRNCREIIERLKNLNKNEIDFFLTTNFTEQKYLLWIAICRYYHFIADFAVEVLRERFISLKGSLNCEDFDSFFNKQSDWYPELEKITENTRHKLRQVLFKIMMEAELLLPENTINTVFLTSSFCSLISENRRKDLLLFPIFDNELARLA